MTDCFLHCEFRGVLDLHVFRQTSEFSCSYIYMYVYLIIYKLFSNVYDGKVSDNPYASHLLLGILLSIVLAVFLYNPECVSNHSCPFISSLPAGLFLLTGGLTSSVLSFFYISSFIRTVRQVQILLSYSWDQVDLDILFSALLIYLCSFPFSRTLCVFENCGKRTNLFPLSLSVQKS